jgi:predicted nucleic acid-binding protein
MAGKPKICWDSCVYISLLTGENRKSEEMKKLYAIEQMITDGRAVVFSSTVTIVEVLDCKLTDEQAEKFRSLIGNPDTPFLNVDTRVAKLASEIRSFYKGKLSTPDAIQLATAIHFEATAFQTYDGSGKRGRPSDLLKLGKVIAGKHKISISVPEIPEEEADLSGMPLLEAAQQSLLEAGEVPPETEKG